MRPEANASGVVSIHRSFVVRLYSDVDLPGVRFAGRIEHVVSGEESEFRSIEQLAGFIERMLHLEPSARATHTDLEER